MFRPVGKGRPAYGPIQPDGTFELNTNSTGDGAMLGEYRVMVAGERDTEDDEQAGTTYVGPRDKTFTVAANATNEFNIEIRVADGWRAVVND